MEEVTVSDGILLRNVKNFNLEQIFNCGQTFRWTKDKDQIWHGVAYGKILSLYQTKQDIFLKTSKQDYDSIWKLYFDLDCDYSLFSKIFSKDPILKDAIMSSSGIRILHQEPWETLCSFIISQNNNIPRIRGIIDRLCKNFGILIDDENYSFPTAEIIASQTIESLGVIRAGFRSKYLIDAAEKVLSKQVDLQKLSVLSTTMAEKELLKIYGVGPKIAQCVLLYGYGRKDAFPIDVWMKRIMSKYYPNGLPKYTKGAEGVAQQYLYHYFRNVFLEN